MAQHQRSRRVSAGCGLLAAGAALAMTGCSGADSYRPATAQLLERQVLAVATAAHGARYAGALAELSQLQRADDAALQQGSLTLACHDAIAAAITQIRADLTVLQVKAQMTALQQRQSQLLQQARRTAAPKGPHHDGGGHDGGNGGGNGGD